MYQTQHTFHIYALPHTASIIYISNNEYKYIFMICMCCDITCVLQYIILRNWVGCQGGARCARVTLSRLNAAH
jgi:hypothetical protein